MSDLIDALDVAINFNSVSFPGINIMSIGTLYRIMATMAPYYKNSNCTECLNKTLDIIHDVILRDNLQFEHFHVEMSQKDFFKFIDGLYATMLLHDGKLIKFYLVNGEIYHGIIYDTGRTIPFSALVEIIDRMEKKSSQSIIGVIEKTMSEYAQ